MEQRPNRPSPEPKQNQSPLESGQYVPGNPVSKPDNAKPQPEKKRSRTFVEPKRSKTRDEAKATARWYMQNRREYTQGNLDKEKVIE